MGLSPTVSSPPTPTRPPCIGVRNKFTTSDGNNCSLYDATWDERDDYFRDDYFRDDDFDYFAICFNHTDPFTNYYAKDVCSECGECVDPLIANTYRQFTVKIAANTLVVVYKVVYVNLILTVLL